MFPPSSLPRKTRRKEQKTWKEQVPDYLHDFADVFTKEDFDELPPHRPWDHAIELLPGTTERLDCKIYQLSVDEQTQLDEFLEENLSTGRIRPSKSPMASPFFFIKKKDGKLRPVQDYRKLNDMTIKNRYPLPLITELIDMLQNARYFTKLDIRWGYNNVRIKKGDEFKAAFRTNRGLFEPLVMFFGLTNSPATFQTMMNDIFHLEIKQGYVLIYLDDILILDRDLDQHHAHVREVLERLREHKLYLKPEKCEFDQTEVEYLGVIVGNGQVKMDPVKVAGIAEWPTPTCKRDIQQFLGFCNFYRRFIHHFADIARPLQVLTGNVPFEWKEECQTSFDQLKTLLTSEPILTIPNPHDKFRLEADASQYAMGAVLMQNQENKWKPIGYTSKAFDAAQRNYDIYDRELLAIMMALEQHRPQLIGTKQPFEIQTDHANLQYFKKPQKLNRRQAKWLTELQDYDFVLTHIPGKQNSKADILSRRPGTETGQNDNDDTILLPESLFISAITQIEPIEFLPQILRAGSNRDPFIKKALEKGNPEVEIAEDGSILFRNLVYVPVDRNLRADVIAHHHDTRMSGHYGENKTIERITRNYWWPTLRKDVKQYIRGCETCQRTKSRRVPLKTPLHPFDPPSQPWEVITLDLVGPLPESQGYNAILTIVDWLSKAVKFEPTNLELNSPGFARILRDRVIRDHGMFKRIIHDRDTRFTSAYTRDLLTLLGSEQNPSTAYHPQTDGQSERMNQTVEQYLRIFIDYHQDDWKEWLALAEFSYNNSMHAATKTTPFFINHGFHPWTGEDSRKEVKNESAAQFATRMKQVHEDAAAALRMANEQAKRQYDKHTRPAVEYEPGSQVYVEATNIKSKRPSKKLDDKRFGPFEVLEKVGESAYRLKLPTSWKGKRPIFNEQYLSPYHPPKYRRQQRPPPPPPVELEDGEQAWDVQEIIDSKRYRGKVKYLVHWKGFTHDDDTWEPIENLDDAQECLEEFHRKYPNKPSHDRVNIRIVESPPDERLFNEETNMPGIHFIPSQEEIPQNAIIALPPHVVNDIYNGDASIIERGWPFNPPLPPHIRRAWIYETEPVNSITCVVKMDDRSRPSKLYQLLDPIGQTRLRQRYNLRENQIPCVAPGWLYRDYKHTVQRVW